MTKKVLHLNSKFKANKANMSTATYFGTEHIVIEGVGSMIADTVMNGILYTRQAVEDLAANTVQNVHAPAAHPSDAQGNFIMAGSPEAIHQNYVGAFAFNYRMKNDRLIHDLAIDPEKAAQSEDGREILRRINEEIDIDTSTGLLIFDMDDTQGIGNDGIEYFAVANQIELDHDAILLRERGAATTLQGVGVFANKDGKKIDVDSFNVNATIANTELEVVDIPFEANGAMERIKEFTNSSDIPSSNYRRFFLDFDRKNTESYDAYNFLFADVVDGKPVAVKEALEGYKTQLEDMDIDSKATILNIVDGYLQKFESMSQQNKKNGFFQNAWSNIKEFFFAKNDLSQRDVQEQIFQLINEGNEDSYPNYPVDIFEDYFIFEKSSGNLFKMEYNIINDKVILSGEPVEVTRKIIYQPLENSEMKELILKALNEAKIDTTDMNDEQLFAAYNSLIAKSDEAEVKADAEVETETEVAANEDLDAKIAKAVANALAEKEEAAAKTEADELATKVVALNKGIKSEEVAKNMGVDGMKDFLAANGTVAFNAKTDYTTINNSGTFSDEMPE